MRSGTALLCVQKWWADQQSWSSAVRTACSVTLSEPAPVLVDSAMPRENVARLERFSRKGQQQLMRFASDYLDNHPALRDDLGPLVFDNDIGPGADVAIEAVIPATATVQQPLLQSTVSGREDMQAALPRVSIPAGLDLVGSGLLGSVSKLVDLNPVVSAEPAASSAVAVTAMAVRSPPAPPAITLATVTPARSLSAALSAMSLTSPASTSAVSSAPVPVLSTGASPVSAGALVSPTSMTPALLTIASSSPSNHTSAPRVIASSASAAYASPASRPNPHAAQSGLLAQTLAVPTASGHAYVHSTGVVSTTPVPASHTPAAAGARSVTHLGPQLTPEEIAYDECQRARLGTMLQLIMPKR